MDGPLPCRNFTFGVQRAFMDPFPGTSQNSNNVLPKVIVCILAFAVEPGSDPTGHALRPKRELIRVDFPELSRPFVRFK